MGATEPTAATGTDDELEAVESEIARLFGILVGEPLPAFIRRISPQHPPAPHLDPLIDLLTQAQLGPVRGLVSMPPRHAKTTTILHGLSWMISRTPLAMHAYATYADELSRSKSRIARRLALAAGARLASDSANLAEWRTIQGGGLLSTGVGGALTGQGVSGCMVVDDPIKNREEAESRVIREKIWDWFNDVAYTRLEPGASCLVVATRWHQDDLIGRLEAQGGWDVVNLPALDEDGEALWPERYTSADLASIRAQIGEHSFASLYQGRPRPRGAEVFGQAHYYDPNEPTQALPPGCRVLIVADPAASESTSADYSAAAVMAAIGYGENMRAWIVEVLRVQCSIPAFVERLAALQAKYRCSVAVESVGGFKSVPQMLRDVKRIHATEIKPLGDKFTRAQPVAAAWNQGRVLVNMRMAGLSDFLAEVTSFTGVKDPHDDQVDTIAHGWNHLAHQPLPRPRQREATFLPIG